MTSPRYARTGRNSSAGTSFHWRHERVDANLGARRCDSGEHSMDEANADFVVALGQAALSMWGDLPRDIQETLFETAMQGRDDQREAMARLLHERHPRTAHPRWPS
jgi:hypothetical protein